MYKNWIYEPTISDYDALLFHNALYRHRDNFTYHPIALAKREEHGIKYRFLCIAAPLPGNNGNSHFSDIEIYKPIKGMPYITCLYRIDFDKMFPQRYPHP